MPKAVDIAYRHLRDGILSGELSSGAPLPEKELADRIGVSRTPVREAIGRLRGEGMVVMERYRKHFVARFDEADRIEIFELRALLEGHAAARAAARITPEQIAALEALCRTMEAAATDDAGEPVFREANQEFHRIIRRAARSPRAYLVLDSALNIPFNLLGRYSSNMAKSMQRACWYHHEIVSALKAGDAARARNQMSAHILSLITTDL